MGVRGLLGVLGVSAFDLLLFDLRMTNSNRHLDIKWIKLSLSTILDVFMGDLAESSHNTVR